MDATKITDWSLIQSFLAVADHGSLSAAARQLGRSQPTLGRHIQSLEAQLSQQLFERHPRGVQLSTAGTALLPMAREMQQQMYHLSLQAAGQSEALVGTVRITASVFAAHYLLPPILAEIRIAEPQIELELVPTDASENLLYRAADIALRMYRPSQLDVITQHVTDWPLGIFAAKSYLDRRGRPKSAEDLWQHDLVGYDSNDLILRSMQAIGWQVERTAFALRCDNQATYWQLVRAGCGIGFCQTAVAHADPGIEELSLGVDIPPLPVWLTTHRAMRETPRIRRVWSLLAKALQNTQKSTPQPPETSPVIDPAATER
ncbi:LysR family transcriptional regulator [Pseudophaeobacter flagellatus]|uniref:LysR family transcriptional regulator n=1 Tax=Pseudophaeobacter flagellatus TaxID=2899119 RepID=UPI001E2950B0|nr:LysR family transcriptional regulator [Pseudophaeobacter flagellatus]MCD9147962.1 LysR family transcriptional regulator [Pseudophaeobacter flagellatus]